MTLEIKVHEIHLEEMAQRVLEEMIEDTVSDFLRGTHAHDVLEDMFEDVSSDLITKAIENAFIQHYQ